MHNNIMPAGQRVEQYKHTTQSYPAIHPPSLCPLCARGILILLLHLLFLHVVLNPGVVWEQTVCCVQ